MLAVGYGECLAEILLVEEVAQQECSASALDGTREIFHSSADVGALALGFEVQEFAYDVQNVLPALLWGDEFLYLVREEDDAYLVVVLYCREGQSGSYFGQHITFHLLLCAEVETSAHIHQQHDGQFSLLFEDLDIRLVEARGHVPFYVAYVIAVLIFPYLRECHAASLERRMVFSGKDIVAQATGLDFYLPDAL